MATRKPRNKMQKAHRRASGFNSLRRNIRKYGDQMGTELQKIAVLTGIRVRDRATQTLRTGSGRAPDPQTYELANSVVLVIQKRNVRVGTPVKHGFYQEFGTTRHKAHPWLFPSLNAEKKFYAAQLQSLHARAVKGIKPEDD
jgi:hypothetical protein